MINQELYEKMVKIFGEGEMHQFSVMVSTMYAIMVKNETNVQNNVHEFESKWWFNKFNENINKRK